MSRRTFEVKGEDVNDFMEMQHFAYLSHASRALHNFLFETGYTKRKLNSLKIGLRECSEKLVHYKHLMFAQSFYVDLELSFKDNDEQKIVVKYSFFNHRDELCTVVHTEMHWFDYNGWEVTTPPKRITRHFFDSKIAS